MAEINPLRANQNYRPGGCVRESQLATRFPIALGVGPVPYHVLSDPEHQTQVVVEQHF